MTFRSEWESWGEEKDSDTNNQGPDRTDTSGGVSGENGLSVIAGLDRKKNRQLAHPWLHNLVECPARPEFGFDGHGGRLVWTDGFRAGISVKKQDCFVFADLEDLRLQAS